MTFLPDSFMVADVLPSPNHGERAGGRHPDMIILHYTGMPDAKEALARLCSAESKVSAHYFVFENGRIVQMVPEMRRAWHAGESVWAGEKDINSVSIGIEIANGGHDVGYPDFPQRQLAAVAALCRGIVIRREIPPHRVLAHSDVAPSRKKDPGEKFPWHFLHSMGVGLWADPLPIVEGPNLTIGDSGALVTSLKSLFAEIGYGVSEDDKFDAQLRDVVSAFQRHYRPERIDGVLDSSTLLTLRRLLEIRPQGPALAPTGESGFADDGQDEAPDEDEAEPDLTQAERDPIP